MDKHSQYIFKYDPVSPSGILLFDYQRDMLKQIKESENEPKRKAIEHPRGGFGKRIL
jgi:hypothetical protein